MTDPTKLAEWEAMVREYDSCGAGVRVQLCKALREACAALRSQGAKLAEAEARIAGLEDSDEGLHRARAAINARSEDICVDIRRLLERAEKAEARVAVLRAALKDVANAAWGCDTAQVAEEVLATEDAAAERLMAELAAARAVCDAVYQVTDHPLMRSTISDPLMGKAKGSLWIDWKRAFDAYDSWRRIRDGGEGT